MGPRFAEEIVEYLRVSGPASFIGLAAHFNRWGATEDDLRAAIDWLLGEGRLARQLDKFERYQLK